MHTTAAISPSSPAIGCVRILCAGAGIVTQSAVMGHDGWNVIFMSLSFFVMIAARAASIQRGLQAWLTNRLAVLFAINRVSIMNILMFVISRRLPPPLNKATITDLSGFPHPHSHPRGNSTHARHFIFLQSHPVDRAHMPQTTGQGHSQGYHWTNKKTST